MIKQKYMMIKKCSNKIQQFNLIHINKKIKKTMKLIKILICRALIKNKKNMRKQ